MEENYTLYHGDCLEEMNKIPDKSVNLPYNIGKTYTTNVEWGIFENIETYVVFHIIFQ